MIGMTALINRDNRSAQQTTGDISRIYTSTAVKAMTLTLMVDTLCWHSSGEKASID
jgi:lactam utilization protein B